MKQYHVKYYYLATGMEGIADTRDFGLIPADSEEEAFDKVAKLRGTYDEYEDNKTYRHWGLYIDKNEEQ